MSLTHWYQYYQILPLRIWQQLTCASLSCSLAIWSMTTVVFMWRHLASITYLLMNFCKYLLFHMKATYLPFHLFQFKFSYANVQFDKKAYPEFRNVEILQKLSKGLHSMTTTVHVSEHVWTMSMLVLSDILSVTLTEVQIWHKGQDYSFVLKQTADVCSHHLLHQQFAELIQHNSSLVNPCLWKNITPFFRKKPLSFSPSNCTYALGGYLACKTLGR